MLNSKIIWAGTLTASLFFALFGCNEDKKPAMKKPVHLETVALDTMPFNCQTDSMIPLGFINHDWVYENKQLGIRFQFPKGWNAIEDVKNDNPFIVPVGGDLTELRDQYTHPHSLKLSLMIGNAWSERRYLFGITKIQPKHSMDETPIDFASAPLAIAQVFYGEEFASEEVLYKSVIATMLDSWEGSNNRKDFELNKSTLHKVSIQQLGNASFYQHDLKFSTNHGIVSATTFVKKLDCIFLVISFNWKNEAERKLLLQALQGIEIHPN